MRFLFPGFLFALLAIAIPVIIHLFNLRKFRKVYFSNVRFLKSVEQQTSSRRQIKNRLILAVRILAIVFLVLAFARPYLPDNNSASAGVADGVSVFVDNSYSMEGVNKEGTLLDEGRRRAREIVSASGPNVRFQLLTNDFEGKHQRWLSREEFLSGLDEIKISGVQRNLSQIIKQQEDIFRDMPGARHTLYVISDFQKNMMPEGKVEADSASDIRLVYLKANPIPNISIDSVWFLSPIHRPGQSEKLLVQVRNHSDQAAARVPLKLLVNKQQKALGNLSIPARGSAVDTLSVSGLAAGWQASEVILTDYPVVFDDHFYFSFFVQPAMKILAINGAEINPYLQAVYASDPFFVLGNTSSGSINYSELGNYPLIILNEVSDISAGLQQQLKDYVSRGGSLLVLPSLNPDLSGLGRLLQNMGADLPSEIVSAESRVKVLNLQNPVFEGVFENIPRKLDLPSAKKFIRYTRQNRSSRQSLLELPGGTGFFNDFTFGKGKVYVSAVPLNDEAGNLQRHSIFVPLMFRIAMLSMHDRRLFYTLGRDQVVEIPKTTLNQNQTLRLRGGQFETIPDMRQAESSTQLYLADQLKQPGNYELFKSDSMLSVLSFNYGSSESAMSYADEGELKSKFPERNISVLQSADGAVQQAVKTAGQGTSLWKLCLILALICLAAEILLVRFYKRAKAVNITTSQEINV